MRESRIGVTNREGCVLTTIEQFIGTNGYSPTLRELGTLLGLRSTATVHAHVASLAKQGAIAWDPTKSRTIRLLRRDVGAAGEEAS